MSISLTRFPEYRLSLTVYGGKLGREEFIGFSADVEADDPANKGAWLIYLAPDLDISAIDCTAFPEAKRILKPKLAAWARDGTLRTALVSAGPQTAFVADFWRDFVGADPEYAGRPEVFSDLHQALAWLGLPVSAYAAVADAVDGTPAKSGTASDAAQLQPGGAER